ncbi:MAG: 3-phosphoshikimate 1-carboxyvinyltransferase, partial [Candidatus Omnitrophica bacterium]|nr:3-phosphoshikimate 1-carboxyvinyltransferase [Candidatus Omnitrophota bacterium]
MESLTVAPAARVRGALDAPGDKSISHRALMLGGIAEGTTRLSHMLDADDCRATQRAMAALGVVIRWTGDEVVVEGRGLRGLTAPAGPLDCGNSGTTMRLLLGLLAGQPFAATLTGDPSLSKRPMQRVTHILRGMGAQVEGR